MSRRRWNTKATPRNGASQCNDSGLTLNRASGFALIEVMVALVLIGVLATAVLSFFTGAMRATSHLQRTQSAYAVAAEAMERVRSVSAVVLPGGTSGILMGRAQSDVLAVWAAAATIDKAGSTAVGDWDPTVTTSVNAAVPLVSDVVRSGVHYTVTTLIGECYRLATGSGGDQSCTVPNPGTAVRVFRVTVVVGWKPTSAGACGGAALCLFRMSSLVDPNTESNWNLAAKPVAYDDNISVVTGDPAVSGDPHTTGYEILANDVIGSVTSNPVTKLSDPAFGTAAVITSGASMGMLNYTPPLAASGLTSLTYMLRDAAGRTSVPGTVNISVFPKAVNDSTSVPLGGSVDISVATNDLGTFATPRVVAIVSGPSVGSASVVNGQIRYVAPASGSSTSLTYTITDTSGLTSTAATVSITLIAPPAPTAVDLAITVNASAPAVATPLDMFARAGMTGNDPANKIFVGVPVASSGWSNVGSLTGSGTSAIGYTPVINTIGVYTFTYYVQNLVGVNSATKTVTLNVSPVATDDTMSVVKKQQQTVDVSSNDFLPATGMTYALGTPSGTGCGTASVAASTGVVSFAPVTVSPSDRRNCMASSSFLRQDSSCAMRFGSAGSAARDFSSLVWL